MAKENNFFKRRKMSKNKVGSGGSTAMFFPFTFESNEQKMTQNVLNETKFGFHNFTSTIGSTCTIKHLEAKEVDNLANVIFYETESPKTFLMHLIHPFQLQICGLFKLTVLRGSVNIYGYTLSRQYLNRSIYVYAHSEKISYLIESGDSSPNAKEDLTNILTTVKLARDDEMTQLSANFQSNDAVLLVEECSLPPICLADRYNMPYLSGLNAFDRGILPKWCPKVKCFIGPLTHKTYRPINIPTRWGQLRISGRNVLIGGSDSGKSTLAKFVVNKLLTTHEEVLYIELDLGQPEFTPPGSIAVIRMKDPIFGANFFHAMTPQKMIHLGEIDVCQCPSNYLDALNKLVKFAEETARDIPWVVNTMGFTKGLGLNITKNVIKCVKPTYVIEIKLSDARRNFKFPMVPENLFNSKLSYDYTPLISVAENLPRSKSGAAKKTARNRMMISYLSMMLSPPSYSFNEVKPYRVAFSNIAIGIMHSIAPGDILRALNCSLVSLSSVTDDFYQRCTRFDVPEEKESWFQICLDPPPLFSVGLGIVRGVDVTRKEIYLITSVNFDDMQSVNFLCISGVSLPPDIFLRQEGVDVEIPYVTNNYDELSMATISRMYRSPKSFVQSSNRDSHPL